MVARKARHESWPPVLLSDASITGRVSAAVKRGELVKVGPRLYTSITDEPPESVVRLHLWDIVRLLFPNLVLGYRTALHAKPTPEGKLFLVGPYARTQRLPGATIRILRGPGPLDGDTPYGGGLYLASQARALLECMRGKRIESESPTLSRDEVEAFVERRIRTGGERWANDVRDRAREIAPALGFESEARALDAMIGAMLGTVGARLESPAAIARAAGMPYDADRAGRFDRLVEALRDYPIPHRADHERAHDAFYNLAFFDAYFSNYIEGTRFPVADAHAIVFEGRIPAQRPRDAHDIIGTYRILSSRHEMFASASEWVDRPQVFLDVLQSRHRAMLDERPEVRSGRFKESPNQAGDTLFVAPELVEATLLDGLQRMRLLTEPFQRAVFMMFLVAEVHPFDDGNGRLARAMMNAELVSQAERRILVPTAFRIDYMGALRRLTRHDDPEVLIRALDRAQDFTARIDFTEYDRARDDLTGYGAFDEGDEARLRMPPARVP